MTNVALLTLLALPSLTTAAPAPPAAPPTPAPPADDAPFAARLHDAQIDQAWFSPTALTQPAGTVSIENHELLVAAVGVAPLDRLQLSIVGTLPLIADSGRFLQGAAKLRVLDAGPLHVSLLGGGGVEQGLFTAAPYDHKFLSAGAVASLCASPACRAVFSLYAFANFTSEARDRAAVGGANWSHHFVKVYYGGSVVVPLASRVKLVSEVDVIGEAHGGESDRTRAARVTAGMLGLRVHSRRVAGTLGLMGVYMTEEDWWEADSINVFVVLPAVSVTVRLGGD